MTMATQGRPWRRKATGLTQAAGFPSQEERLEVNGVKISNEQIQKVREGVSPSQKTVDEAVIKLVDADLIKEVVADINAMPDREEFVAELRARIEAGTYNPSSEDIADTMVRRAIADKIR